MRSVPRFCVFVFAVTIVGLSDAASLAGEIKDSQIGSSNVASGERVLEAGAAGGSSRAGGEEVPATAMRLRDVMDLVLSHNEGLQVSMLDAQISRKTHEAEKGIFEPQVVGSVERIDTRRPNNTQQTLNLGFQPRSELKERNTLYYGGLEFLAPAGSRVRAGYTLRALGNNLQRAVDREYETFVGVSVSQPLLKNFGRAATMARIRLAALGSDIAFQEYRRHLMILVSQVEAAYWDLYQAQELEGLAKESAGLARKILTDNRARKEVGISTDLEVLQAEAQFHLRQARKDEARLKVFEGGKHLSAYYSDDTVQSDLFLTVIDEPGVLEVDLASFHNYQMAYSSNPDYWIRLRQVEQEEIKLKYARNQRLPQLDLKGSYGFNGLGNSAGASWDDVPDKGHPSWSLGLELRIPVTGGIRERNELEAAKLSKQRALLQLKDADTQIANGLDTGIQRVRTYLQNVENYRSVAEFHQKLLDAQLAQLEVGRIDTRSVLETEEKLFEAKLSVVEMLVSYRKALLELELIRGSTLWSRGLEISRNDLDRSTMDLARRRDWPREELEAARERLRQELQKE